jgi:hypothetical protein
VLQDPTLPEMPPESPANAPDGAPQPAAEDGLDDGVAGEDTLLSEDIAALIESGRTYAEAELAFQKTRAALAVSNAAKAAGALVLALVLLNIALTALAIGAVLALQPIITIWGAIGVVVGALLLATALLVRNAAARGKLLSVMFGDGSAR